MRLSRGSKWFLAFGILALAGVAAGLWWVDQTFFGDDDVEPGLPIEYTVEQGASVRTVGDDLADQGVISSPVRFRLAAEDAGLADELQPGVFEFETGMDNDEALAVLAAGPIAPPGLRFTVPEGLTVPQTLERIDAQLEDYELAEFEQVLEERVEAGENADDVLQMPEWIQEPADRGDEVDPFEGVLWPQTYDIDEGAEPVEILQAMVDRLEAEIEAIPAEQREELSDVELYDRLVVASLVERETRVDDERETVAGVIANRLEEDMRLQIDATVVYALGGEPTDIVSLDDLEIDSPYNTYQVDGLPPSPISGVGSAALAAAFAPADVPYRFYVLDPACDGTHRFAETDDEHQENVEAFRDAGRCQDEDLGDDPDAELDEEVGEVIEEEQRDGPIIDDDVEQVEEINGPEEADGAGEPDEVPPGDDELEEAEEQE